MKGKCSSWTEYLRIKSVRAVLRIPFRRLLEWKPVEDPHPGYTIIIGCNSGLAAMTGAVLRMLQRQRRDNVHRIVVVLDRPKEQLSFPVEDRMRERFPDLPLTFVYYNSTQARVLGMVAWGWAYAWLSWSIGIAHAGTKYALLQDFDALLLRETILEERYAAILSRGDEYVGTRWYRGCGVEEQDHLVVTPEMVFDAEFVRQHFKPLDLFNHVTIHKGRSVDFDTMLYAQSRAGRRSILTLDEEEWVHPSQMICQYVEHVNGRSVPERNNLLMIPYFMYFGGEPELFNKVLADLRAEKEAVELFGRPVSIARLPLAHAQWLKKQALRLEEGFGGDPATDVQEYFDRIESAATRTISGAHATVVAGL